MKINPSGSDSTDFDVSPSINEYDSGGESSDAEPQCSQLWEGSQEEEAHLEVNKEAPIHNAYPSPREHD